MAGNVIGILIPSQRKIKGITPPPSEITDAILLENGVGALLTEDGKYIKIEQSVTPDIITDALLLENNQGVLLTETGQYFKLESVQAKQEEVRINNTFDKSYWHF